MATLEQYIRDKALRLGIDPNIAITVARHEGGLKDPVRQSDVRKNGVREPSYGPFQLLVGGGETGFPEGLGNDFMRATGKDPRLPENAQAGIDYALETAKRDGWGRWYGAKAAGLDRYAGIGGAPQAGQGLTLDSVPASVVSTGNAPMLPDPKEVRTVPVAGVPTSGPDPVTSAASPEVQQDLADKVKSLITNATTEGSPMNKNLAALKSIAPKPFVDNSPIVSTLPATEATDAARAASAQQLMATLIGGRRRTPIGLQLNGRPA